MNLIVFGATGNIGQQVVSQALTAGHEVSAFTRSPGKINKPQKNLRIIQGDVLDLDAVSTAITGHDAVICTLGMPITNKQGLRAKGTHNIIQAMKNADIGRLVCLSVYGAGDSWDSLPFSYKYLILPLLLRHVVKDHNAQENHITNSDLDWSIVRPVNFTKGPHTGIYRHDFSTKGNTPTFKISQTDVADFMLAHLANDIHLHKTPGISY